MVGVFYGEGEGKRLELGGWKVVDGGGENSYGVVGEGWKL